MSVIEDRFPLQCTQEPPDRLGAFALQVECGNSILSMSIKGFDAMPDDTMIGFWLSDNFDGTPEEPTDAIPASPMRLKLQAMMDGPMVGSGIGS